MEPTSLIIQFKSECYKRYLIANPKRIKASAIHYFEQFTILANKYQILEAQNKQLKSALAQAHLANPSSLPTFIDEVI